VDIDELEITLAEEDLEVLKGTGGSDYTKTDWSKAADKYKK